MRRRLRQIRAAMPVDGCGWAESGDPDIDRIRRLGAATVWKRRPAWLRPLGPPATRLVWALVAAQRVFKFAKAEKLRLGAAFALFWDCLLSGASAAEAHIHRAHFGRRHPFPGRAVVVSLPLIGDPAAHLILSDKQATAERLVAAGLDVPRLYAEIARGDRPDLSVAPWTAPAGLLIKPRHGHNGHGIRVVDVGGPGLLVSPSGAPLPPQRFADTLARLARRDSVLVQERLTAAPQLTGLTVGVKPPVLRIAVARAPGEPPFVHSALFAMDMPEVDPNDLLRGKLRAPLDVATGRLGPAILFGSPRERFAAAPWSGAPIAGFELPHFAQAIAAVLKATELFPGLAIINWELVLAPRGPVFLEGNTAGNWNTTEFPRIDAPEYPSVAATLARWL